MSVPSTVYSYNYLHNSRNEIRLLWFLEIPKDSKAPLRCEMRTASLEDQNLEYNALSYCWGAPDFNVLLEVNKFECRITESLDKALRQALPLCLPRPIWVDQLCINQSDDSDRTKQVRLMSRIYAQTTTCFCYLGNVFRERFIYLQPQHLLLEDGRFFISAPNQAFLYEEVTPDPKTPASFSSRFRAMSAIFESDYFKRKWTIQESFLPKNPICLIDGAMLGLLTFSLSDLCSTEEQFLSSGIANRMGNRLLDSGVYREAAYWHGRGSTFTTMMRARQARPEPESSFELTELLAVTLHASASEPRDHVYAVLGLASDKDSFPLPDYSCCVSKVYTDLAEAAIRIGDGLSYLDLATKCMPRADLPSWVPNLAHPLEDLDVPTNGQITLMESQEAMQQYISKGWPKRTHIENAPQSGTVLVPCLLLGDIVFGGSPAGNTPDTLVVSTKLTSIYNMVEGITASSGLQPSHFWARIADFLIDLVPRRVARFANFDTPDREIFLKVLPQLAEGTDPKHIYMREGQIEPKTMYACDEIDTIMRKWRIYSIRTGHLGATITDASEGDKFVIVGGNKIPAVVRDAGQGRFRLIGRALIPQLAQCIQFSHNEQGKSWWKVPTFHTPVTCKTLLFE